MLPGAAQEVNFDFLYVGDGQYSMEFMESRADSASTGENSFLYPQVIYSPLTFRTSCYVGAFCVLRKTR